jgi:hypothetical protein
MKKAVLSVAIFFLFVFSVAQVPVLPKFQISSDSLSLSGNQNHIVRNRNILQPVVLPRNLAIPEAYDFSFGKSANPGIMKLNAELLNQTYIRSYNFSMHHNIENAPDLSEVWGKPVIIKFSQRALFIRLSGGAIDDGVYFNMPNRYNDYPGAYQDTKGEIYTLIPGWRKGEYLPVINGPRGFYYIGGNFPKKLYPSIKSKK